MLSCSRVILCLCSQSSQIDKIRCPVRPHHSNIKTRDRGLDLSSALFLRSRRLALKTQFRLHKPLLSYRLFLIILCALNSFIHSRFYELTCSSSSFLNSYSFALHSDLLESFIITLLIYVSIFSQLQSFNNATSCNNNVSISLL